MKQKQTEPKDLGLKVGTEKEVFWTQIKKEAENAIKESEYAIMYQKEVALIAEKNIEKEKGLNSSIPKE